MPARRSEDPTLTEAEKAGAGAHEHWDEAARAAARPAPIDRSLPNRDNSSDSDPSAPTPDAQESGTACEDDGGPATASGGQKATDE